MDTISLPRCSNRNPKPNPNYCFRLEAPVGVCIGDLHENDIRSFEVHEQSHVGCMSGLTSPKCCKGDVTQVVFVADEMAKQEKLMQSRSKHG